MRKEEHTARALLLRLKPDGGCLSNSCVCLYVCVCMWVCVECTVEGKKRKERKTKWGLNQYLGVSFQCQRGAREEVHLCWQGSLNLALCWHRHTHTHTNTPSLNYVWNAAIISCFTRRKSQEKDCACVCVTRECVTTQPACAIVGSLGAKKKEEVENCFHQRTITPRQQVDIICDCQCGEQRTEVVYLKTCSYKVEERYKTKINTF